MEPTDYYGQPIAVGDTVRAMCEDSRGGLPLYATNVDLLVVKLGRTRVEVEGIAAFNGTIRPRAEFVKVVRSLAPSSGKGGEG